MTNSVTLALQEPLPITENPLQIVSAGVEASEDAPFVTSDFRFLPGDYVYLQFQISGYGTITNENNDVRKISLSYEIVPQDDKGVPLTEALSGVIKEDLGTEDKNWMPKRRASFLLPSFMAAGSYHVRFIVKDLIKKTSRSRDIAFRVGGTLVIPSSVLMVQDFQFLRKEDDADALEVPAYRPGDTVYARFMMTGFRLAAGNEYHLSYGLTVTRPGGKPYLNQISAAELSDKSFYPVPFVPGNVSITTSRTSAKGEYVLQLTVRDVTGAQSYQLKKTFTIE